MPKISIIVPIYKVEKYLNRCVDSILNQTFTDFELILVDDGSPDNCGKICDEYIKNDKRVIVVHKMNGGVSSARNIGLKISNGEYIGFVDPDDFIDFNMYERMYHSAFAKDCDLVVCGVRVVSEDIFKLYDQILSVSGLVSNETCLKLFFNYEPIRPSVCNKLFKKNIINCFFNESISISEDFVFLINYLLNAKNVYLISDCLYFNRRRISSVTNSGASIAQIMSIVDTDYLIYNIIKNNFVEMESITAAWILQDNLGWLSVASQSVTSNSDKKYINIMKRGIFKHKWIWVNNKFVSWKLKLRLFFGLL